MRKALKRTKPPTKIGGETENGHQQEKGSEFKEEDLKVVVEELRHHSGVVGSSKTFIAFKNETSYAIGTFRAGLKVVEVDNEVYSEYFSEDQARLDDIVYIHHLDCYLLKLYGKVYRKDVDENPPYLYMDLNYGCNYGRCFRYSKVNRRLVVFKNELTLSVVNLERKQAEIEVNLGKEYGGIHDFIVFGPFEEKVA